jgi:prepilin-type N-terminal cleavage/methylation domain-containing protein
MAIATTLALAASGACAQSAQWSATSALDAWTYVNFGGGTRPFASTFTGGVPLNAEKTAFVPQTAASPARVGLALMAFNTASTATPITAGLPPNRYAVRSVTLKVSMERGGSGDLLYRSTPVANAEILADAVAGFATSYRPLELYGVGFRGGYTGFGFGPFVAGPPLFHETDSSYPAGGYVTYPIAGAATPCCGVADVMNSLSGGFSATAPGNTTTPFDPVPWAIGTAPLAEHAVIPDGTEFTFALDLSNIAARQYVQQSLSKGELGFYLSSWHSTGELGSGGAFPNWAMKEAVNIGYPAPKLEIVYDIVAPRTGDFDADGDVDGADFLLWQCSQGAEVTPHLGADGNGDGRVDRGDLASWQNHFGPAATGSAAAVPEPATAAAALATAVSGICLGRLGRRRATASETSALRRRRTRGAGFTLVELLVVIAIIGALVALLLPAIQAAREACRRASCQNNLKQIGLAVQHYQSAMGHLPPPKAGDTTYNNRGSTLVLLLPYLEQSAMYARYDLTKDVTDPVNLPITGEAVSAYLCPSMSLQRAVPERAFGEVLGPGSYIISTRTAYREWAALDGAFENPTDRPYTLDFKHIADGTSRTLLVGEVNYGHQDFTWEEAGAPDTPKWGDQTWAEGYWALSWGHMSAQRPQLYNNSALFVAPDSKRTFRSDHPGGVQFVMLDGSVRWLGSDSDPEVRKALVTRAGDELLSSTN